uniref:Salivary glands proteinase inhibitor n=1 Tax=Nauphoeta cinerea TaxID=6990 RepID=D2X5N4_NAUCI|nr:salivary glands proteinase inhibitor [Nauphoeta cinerea]
MRTSVVVLAVVALIGAVIADERCSSACTLEYNPICGADALNHYETFGNPCAFNYYNCEHPFSPMRLVRAGECTAAETDEE